MRIPRPLPYCFLTPRQNIIKKMSPNQNVDILKLFHPKEVKMLVCLADLLVDLKIYSTTAGTNIKQTTAILKQKLNRKSLNTRIKLSLKYNKFYENQWIHFCS